MLLFEKRGRRSESSNPIMSTLAKLPYHEVIVTAQGRRLRFRPRGCLPQASAFPKTR